MPAWEEPRRGSLVTEGGVAPAGCGELADEAGEWLGEDDGLAAECSRTVLPVAWTWSRVRRLITDGHWA